MAEAKPPGPPNDEPDEKNSPGGAAAPGPGRPGDVPKNEAQQGEACEGAAPAEAFEPDIEPGENFDEPEREPEPDPRKRGTSERPKSEKPPEPPPPPPPPKQEPAAKKEPIKKEPPKKRDLLRPVRYASSFVSGTIFGMLDGMGSWARKGLVAGAAGGLLLGMAGVPAMFAIGTASAIVTAAAAGLLGGAVLGGAFGVVTGGARNVGREHRKDVYAEDLQAKEAAKSEARPRSDFREARHEHHRRTSFVMDRVFQQERENERDVDRYFRDTVEASRQGQHERGVW